MIQNESKDDERQTVDSKVQQSIIVSSSAVGLSSLAAVLISATFNLLSRRGGLLVVFRLAPSVQSLRLSYYLCSLQASFISHYRHNNRTLFSAVKRNKHQNCLNFLSWTKWTWFKSSSPGGSYWEQRPTSEHDINFPERLDVVVVD